MSIDNRKFKFAGSSVDADGIHKARFANSLGARLKVLARQGRVSSTLIELPEPMTKLEAIAHLQTVKPDGVNQEALTAKATYINAQVTKATNVGLVKRGRPARTVVATTVDTNRKSQAKA